MVELVPLRRGKYALRRINGMTVRSLKLAGNRRFHLFADFPDDIKRLILSTILVVNPRPITNPWMQLLTAKELYYVPRDKKNLRNTFFNINILATCKYFHEIGLKLLYEQNTFLFTLIGQSCRVNEATIHMPIQTLHDFLAAQVTIYCPEEPARQVTRASMIRRVVIQESDADCHVHARRGFARPHHRQPTSSLRRNGFRDEYTFFMTSTLERLFILKCTLSHLTITIDEVNIDVLWSLELLSKINNRRDPTIRTYLRAQSDNGRLTFEVYPFYGHEMKIGLLTVLGSMSPIQDPRRPTPSRSLETSSIRDTREATPSGPCGAKNLQRWLSTMNIKPEIIYFTGPFDKRVLDGLGNIPGVPPAWRIRAETRLWQRFRQEVGIWRNRRS